MTDNSVPSSPTTPSSDIPLPEPLALGTPDSQSRLRPIIQFLCTASGVTAAIDTVGIPLTRETRYWVLLFSFLMILGFFHKNLEKRLGNKGWLAKDIIVLSGTLAHFLRLDKYKKIYAIGIIAGCLLGSAATFAFGSKEDAEGNLRGVIASRFEQVAAFQDLINITEETNIKIKNIEQQIERLGTTPMALIASIKTDNRDAAIKLLKAGVKIDTAGDLRNASSGQFTPGMKAALSEFMPIAGEIACAPGIAGLNETVWVDLRDETQVRKIIFLCGKEKSIEALTQMVGQNHNWQLEIDKNNKRYFDGCYRSYVSMFHGTQRDRATKYLDENQKRFVDQVYSAVQSGRSTEDAVIAQATIACNQQVEESNKQRENLHGKPMPYSTWLEWARTAQY
jgi:hypothetical protein